MDITKRLQELSFDSEQPFHATIITKVENGEIYFAGRTTPRKDCPLVEVIKDDVVFIIRILDDAS